MSTELVLRGQIMRVLRRGLFKIGIVIGPSLAPNKVRVCVWSNAARTWSKPQPIAIDRLLHIQMAKLTRRELAVVSHALESVALRAGEVVWKDGAAMIQGAHL